MAAAVLFCCRPAHMRGARGSSHIITSGGRSPVKTTYMPIFAYFMFQIWPPGCDCRAGYYRVGNFGGCSRCWLYYRTNRWRRTSCGHLSSSKTSKSKSQNHSEFQSNLSSRNDRAMAGWSMISEGYISVSLGKSLSLKFNNSFVGYIDTLHSCTHRYYRPTVV